MTESERKRIFASARDAVLAALPDVWAIYVYGSFASGDEWPRSDLDLAVLMPPEKDIPDFLGLLGKVATSVGRDVDLIDLRRASDAIRGEVLARGQAIYVPEPHRVLDWEASAMSRYSRHRDEIRDILDDFKRTGIGYRP